MKHRGPLFWLRIVGRVLIGRHDDPVDKLKPLYLVPPTTSSHSSASIQFHRTPRSVTLGPTPNGAKLHIFLRSKNQLFYMCGAKLRGKTALFAGRTSEPRLCKTCLKLYSNYEEQ